jgi:hypothetical protein
MLTGLGCDCNQGARLLGLGDTVIGGVVVPSTSDPTGTPVVNSSGTVVGTLGPTGNVVPISASNPAPAVQQGNAQIAPSVVAPGTLSSSGQACNTNGGYVWNGEQCVMQGTPQPSITPAQAAQQQISQAIAQQQQQYSTPPTNPTNPITGSTLAQPSQAQSSDLMLGTFDVTSFFNQYGIWVAGGIAAVVLLSSMSRR